MANETKSDPIFLSEQEFRKRFNYDPDKILGEGGFARVYKAYDRQFDEVVALKFYSHLEANKYDVMREMRNSRKFTHKNIIRVHEAHIIRQNNRYGRTEDVQVGVLEFANGGNLRDFLLTVPTEEQFKEVVIGILEGLEYLHKEKRTIHRDLSPDNVLMFIEGGRWTPKIADFGISKQLDVGTIQLNDQKLSSQLIGKVEYMAPEQFDPKQYGINGKINTNVDLWAFGVVLVEMFSRSNPFGDRNTTESPMQVMHNILHDPIPKFVYDIPEPYRTVIEHCLVKNAQKRVQTAGELIRLIQQYKAKKKPKLSPSLLRTTLAIVLLLGFSLLVFWLVSGSSLIRHTNENKDRTSVEREFNEAEVVRPTFTVKPTEVALEEDFAEPATVTVTADEGTPQSSYSLSPASVDFADVSIDKNSNKVSITAKKGKHGSQKFTIIADAGDGYTATEEFSLTVKAVNNAPIFKLTGDPPAVEDRAGPQMINNFATNIDDGDPEVEQQLSFSLTQSGGELTFTRTPAIDQNGTLTYQPAQNISGTATFEAILEDNGAAGGKHQHQSQPQFFTIEVWKRSPPPPEVTHPFDEILRSFKRELDDLDSPESDYALRIQRIQPILNKYFVNEQVPIKMNKSGNTSQQKEASDFLLNVVITAKDNPNREWEIIAAKPNADDKIVSLTVKEKP